MSLSWVQCDLWFNKTVIFSMLHLILSMQENHQIFRGEKILISRCLSYKPMHFIWGICYVALLQGLKLFSIHHTAEAELKDVCCSLTFLLSSNILSQLHGDISWGKNKCWISLFLQQQHDNSKLVWWLKICLYTQKETGKLKYNNTHAYKVLPGPSVTVLDSTARQTRKKKIMIQWES